MWIEKPPSALATVARSVFVTHRMSLLLRARHTHAEMEIYSN